MANENVAGKLLPFDGGAVAILGSSNEPLEYFERRMLSAIEWSTG